jgi:hypothetical protein
MLCKLYTVTKVPLVVFVWCVLYQPGCVLWSSASGSTQSLPAAYLCLMDGFWDFPHKLSAQSPILSLWLSAVVATASPAREGMGSISTCTTFEDQGRPSLRELPQKLSLWQGSQNLSTGHKSASRAEGRIQPAIGSYWVMESTMMCHKIYI